MTPCTASWKRTGQRLAGAVTGEACGSLQRDLRKVSTEMFCILVGVLVT